VANRNKNKREAKLGFKIYLKQFIILYDFNYSYGLFFGLNRKFCKAVKRNKIKRTFREYFRLFVKPVLDINGKNEYSICLVSKKTCRFENIEDIKLDIKKGLNKLAEKITSNN